MRAFRYTQGLTVLSAAMEVTVRGMVAYSHPCDRDIRMSYTADATFEHPWTDWLRVTVMAVLNRKCIIVSNYFRSI